VAAEAARGRTTSVTNAATASAVNARTVQSALSLPVVAGAAAESPLTG
jgi:hypothetical protein